MRILVVEDEARLASIIRRGLVEAGYSVDNAYDGEEAQFMAEHTRYDAIVLDILLPKKDGLAVCSTLRKKRIAVPIIMLTAKDTVDDRIKGLDAGADDYLVKPFSFGELLARLRALVRRTGPALSHRLEAGDLVMDTLNREVTLGGSRVELTATEYAMLEYLMRHPNAVVTRTMLEEAVWDYRFAGTSNIVDVYIRRLRSKLQTGNGAGFIETVRGAGYRLRK